MTEIDVPQVADLEIAALVRAEVERRWPLDVQGIEELARYGLIPFGKMMGPWLLIRSSLATGGDVKSVLPAAVAVECIQVGAMMHDDIVDGDPQRRSKLAAHAAFGQGTAIIGGDGLFFHGFAALADCQRAGAPVELVGAALTILSQTGLRIGNAAVEEIRMGRSICSTSTYLNMIKDKSGALLWMACGVGATLAGADRKSLAALRSYSDLLGVGYQIRDDLMAYDGTRAGKPNISDIRNGRPTLPVLLAHRRSTREQQRLIEHLLADTTTPVEERHEAMAEIVEVSGAVRSARRMSHLYAHLAGRALDELPPSVHRDVLVELTVPGRLV
ncbi:polyprenyl synthetase family protein [Actinoalloteichus hymeniacidonis]|uniref:Geranylgeranyl pyrophosphate synthase n=1 Tax=Actinoalloteichus hymeniacidonis TaxID=340345 RepID=A0AAC9MZL5_9PSEU|nr:polyprenyl synthetase family protein [Actinoalloteichus hymeniacidonis]AOS64500.1 geranylgeranyl pyrophosphate synthase [Actinoalloteichus hymeniacidonis]MBB5907429.1 geranylgeranyl pyrophosphate synthase [Actinoalloteichus hymeniacidonis]